MNSTFTRHVPFLLCFAVLGSVKLLAQPAGWAHVKPFTVKENTGTTVHNYQLRMEFDTQTPIANGEMNAAGNDLRFGPDCAGSSFYNYWIESGINTPNTVVWVKIDSLPGNKSVPLYMYYGNSSATALSNIPGTFNGPHSGTDSVNNTNLSSSGDCQRGFRFSPTEDVLITAFGRFEPNGTTRYLTLFDFASQAILRQMQVGGPANQYTYGNLAAPIWLTQNTQYLMEMFTPNGESYYFGAAPQIGQHMVYYDMKYCNGCNQNTFPTNTLGSLHYGYPDFWYYIKNNVTPAPTYMENFGVTLASDSSICLNDSLTLAPEIQGAAGTLTYLWSPAGGLSSVADSSVLAGPLVTTTYTLTITDECLTQANASVTITLDTLPAVWAGADIQLCLSDSTVLQSAGTASAYSWNNGITDSVYFTPSVSLDYVLTGIDNLTGCTNRDTTSITVNMLPTVSAGNDVVACLQDQITLTGTGAVSFSWTGGITNATPFSLTSLGAFDYIVTGTDANTCTNSDTVTVTVLSCSGLDDVGIFSANVYPNPTSGILHIITQNHTGKLDVKLVDMNGRVWLSRTFASGDNLTLDLNGLADGVYVLRVNNNGKTALSRVVLHEK